MFRVLAFNFFCSPQDPAEHHWSSTLSYW